MAAETVDADGVERRWAVYDTGQAAAHLTTQAGAAGLAVRQMGGFDAATLPALPGRVVPLAILAVGTELERERIPDGHPTRLGPALATRSTNSCSTPTDRSAGRWRGSRSTAGLGRGGRGDRAGDVPAVARRRPHIDGAPHELGYDTLVYALGSGADLRVQLVTGDTVTRRTVRCTRRRSRAHRRRVDAGRLMPGCGDQTK